MDTLVESVVNHHLDSTFPGAVILAARGGAVYFRRQFGRRVLHPHPEGITIDTVFDLASLSKPLGTTLVALALIDRGTIALDTRVGAVLDSVPSTTAALTIEQLLTHTAGLPAVPMLQRFFPDPALVDRKTARRRLLQIEPERPPGSEVVYSCTGFQILGEVLAAAAGARLDVLHAQLVATPLGLESTRYAPPDAWRGRCAGTELCRWRDRWVRGEVHDESAYAMEGVAGNAGLFSTADEVLAMSELYRLRGTVPTAGGTYTLASTELFERAERSHTDGKAQRRGLGLQLNSAAAAGRAEAAGGPDLSRDSYGHTGFTGTSFWIDPARDITVVAMTNRLQFGRDETADAIKRFRRELHSAFARLYPSFSA